MVQGSTTKHAQHVRKILCSQRLAHRERTPTLRTTEHSITPTRKNHYSTTQKSISVEGCCSWLRSAVDKPFVPARKTDSVKKGLEACICKSVQQPGASKCFSTSSESFSRHLPKLLNKFYARSSSKMRPKTDCYGSSRQCVCQSSHRIGPVARAVHRMAASEQHRPGPLLAGRPSNPSKVDFCQTRELERQCREGVSSNITMKVRAIISVFWPSLQIFSTMGCQLEVYH